MKHFYKSIPGWFDFQDIYSQAVSDASDGSYFVEVGTWEGSSAAYMAVEIANSEKKIKFDVVDTWKGDAGTGPVSKDLRRSFIANMKKGNAFKYISNVVTGISVKAAKRYEDESLDFVFIDADHSYESVLKDVATWYPKMKPGKMMAGHDIQQMEVKRAVVEYFGKLGKKVIRRKWSWVVYT
jgi:predicted O-methyltransferase YrrM